MDEDTKRICAELDHIRTYFEAKADTCIGNGKMLLLNWANVARDAEEMLKAREPVEPILALNDGEHKLWQCGNCKVAVFTRDTKYCHNCGKVVKWDG